MAVRYCETCRENHKIFAPCPHGALADEIASLHEFNFYKQMILNKKTNGRNIIIERKDGSCYIALHQVKRETDFIPGSLHISDMERITIFLDGKEYEFVACQ